MSPIERSGGGGGGGGAPSGPAGGDLGGTYPNPTVVSGTHLAAATVPIAALADPTTGKVIGSSGAAAAAVFPPGFELNYTQITTTTNVTDTSEATATALISPGAITFDGTAVMFEFFAIVTCPTAAASNTISFTLFEGATEITQLAVVRSLLTTTANIETVFSRFRFTPTVGSHTYKLCGVVSSVTGTPGILAGSGGTAGKPPAFVRFTKV